MNKILSISFLVLLIIAVFLSCKSKSNSNQTNDENITEVKKTDDPYVGNWHKGTPGNNDYDGYCEIKIIKSGDKSYIIEITNKYVGNYWGGMYELNDNGNLVKSGIGGWTFMLDGSMLKSTTIEGKFTTWTRL